MKFILSLVITSMISLNTYGVSSKGLIYQKVISALTISKVSDMYIDALKAIIQL